MRMLDARERRHPGYAVRVGDWKAVVQSCSNVTARAPSMADVMELYDLVNDPGETIDVAGAHLTVVMQIKTMLMSKRLSCQCYQC